MRIGLLINYSTDFRTAAGEAEVFAAKGVELLAVPEAYAFDAPSQLGYLAGRIPSVSLTTSVIPIYSRTPALIGMTAATLDYLTDGRFSLGLGTSGPQVIEGLHGVPYHAPLGRTREVIEICRTVWTGAKVTHSGRHHPLPLPADRGTGLGKPLALISTPIRPDIPILVAALGPKNVELTAEIADGGSRCSSRPSDSATSGASPSTGAVTPAPNTLAHWTSTHRCRWPRTVRDHPAMRPSSGTTPSTSGGLPNATPTTVWRVRTASTRPPRRSRSTS
ncbi:LLM class flavin-dependent oxidoreductase [Gordonia sp. i37]|uniref:LLM class flavin-dependent oxidoreductase n=1 Tax=Gordonia sp. i37 TaxID=1961707 RepID=UPI00209B9044|nr:LLM class flavin-dependent oxidoreductase [Gordonia sp. i37]